MNSMTYGNPLFLNNKYNKWYDSITTRAKNRVLNGYFEKHHIIPKSMGGNNTTDNVVKLTAKEHFICHLLLIKMTVGEQKKKMIWAVQRFINRNKGQNCVSVTSRKYAYIRELYVQNHPMKEKSVSDKVKNTQIAKYGNYAFATEKAFNKKKAESMKKYGVEYEFLSNPANAKNNAIISTCPHCGKTGKTIGAMKLWHFDRCRAKN